MKDTSRTDRADEAVQAASEIFERGLRQAIDFDAGLDAVYAAAEEPGADTDVSYPAALPSARRSVAERAGRILRILTGVDEKLLDSLWEERVRYTTLGITALIGAVVSAASLFAAISEVTGNVGAAAVSSGFWLLFTLNLNRYLLSSAAIAPTARRWRWLMLPRLAISALLGVIIAQPLTLWVFQRTLAGRLGNYHHSPATLLDRLQALSVLAHQNSWLGRAAWATFILIVLVDCLPVLLRILGGATAYDHLARFRQKNADRIASIGYEMNERLAQARADVQRYRIEADARRELKRIELDERRLHVEAEARLDAQVDELFTRLRSRGITSHPDEAARIADQPAKGARDEARW